MEINIEFDPYKTPAPGEWRTSADNAVDDLRAKLEEANLIIAGAIRSASENYKYCPGDNLLGSFHIPNDEYKCKGMDAKREKERTIACWRKLFLEDGKGEANEKTKS